MKIRSKDTLQYKTALVTGASSGIGEATAERLAMAGYKVYGTSRRAAKASQPSFEVLPLDVTSDESVEATIREVLRAEGRIDLLVNNAGFSVAPAGAEESSIEQARSIFDTNFFGIVRMTRAVVPHMRFQGSGRIINIGSVLGFLPAPYMALYSATKHAVEGYSESLDHELRTRGIRVSVIEPAYTKTQFDANFLEPDSMLDEYREIRASLRKTFTEVMAAADDPSVVADVVLEAASAARPKLRSTAGVRAGHARVSELRARRAGSLEHDVGHDAWIIGSGHHLGERLAQGSANLAILIELGVGLQEVRVELRLRICGLDDRYPDAPRAQLMVERFRIAFDRVLGRGIKRHVRCRQEAQHGTDIDDATAPLEPHVRHNGSRHPHDPEEVRIENRSRLLDGALFRSGGGDTEARVVHEQVDSALRAQHFPDGGLDGFIASHVEGQ